MCRRPPGCPVAAVVPRVVAAPPRGGDRVVGDLSRNRLDRSPETPVGALRVPGGDRNNPREVAHNRGKRVDPSLRCLLESASSIGTELVRRVTPARTGMRNLDPDRPAQLATAAAGTDSRVRAINRLPNLEERSTKSATGTRKVLAV